VVSLVRLAVERLGGGDVGLLARRLRTEGFGLLHEIPALFQGGGTGSAREKASHRGFPPPPLGHRAAGVNVGDRGKTPPRLRAREGVQHCDRLIERLLDASLAGDGKMPLAPLSRRATLARRRQDRRRQQTSHERCVSQISDRLHDGSPPSVSEYILTNQLSSQCTWALDRSFPQ